MDDYTQREKNMFDDEVFEILAENKINISDVTWDYLYTLSEEEIKRINDLFIKVSKDGIVGKLRLNAETANIRLKAEKWKKSQNNQTEDVVILETQNIETEKDYSHLNPVRHRKGDFFVADIFNSPVMRDDIASMEFPIFALKPKDTKIVEFEINNIKTTIKPSVEIGRATIFDKDIWIYAISKLMQAKYEGKEINQTIRFTAYDYLHTTNRQTGGSQYQQFKEALDRLQGTNITTEIETGGMKQSKGFGLIDGWGVVEKDKRGRMLAVEIKLPDWLYRVVLNDEVKAISPDYFRLRKPIDRRIYEIVAKHIGRKNEWKIGLRKLYEKTGATMLLKKFKFNIQSLVSTNELPDYCIDYDRASDIVIFTLRDETSQAECEEKRQKAEEQKKRLKGSKKIEINPEFVLKIKESIRYYPQFYNAGILADNFLKNCLKDYTEEHILLVFEKCKKVNFDRIENPKAYFLKVLKNGQRT
ncbi:MAG: replication initiator protein A [Neisseriaceae bacterium]|nr:replication initiator protein A [Neisseriaceae bacterium]MCV2508866.1 replication initiator protein A [Neisseriaceae bacterium]